MKRRKFALCAVYDTETTNYLPEGDKEVKHTRAFPILFIDNDIRDVDIATYEPDENDKINFYRHESEMQARIDEYVDWGKFAKVVPIICAYNLMFDLHPLMEELARRYDVKANAQSSTNVYTVDLYEKGSDFHVLRFWDTFHLEMRGLDAMGRTCGLAKAKGDWDYTLVRTPETELTERELFYAGRDTQVIPAYLRYLLHANEWMKQEDFGCRVLTKTSIVRQMAIRTIGRSFVDKRNGKKLSLEKSMIELCKKEAPKTYGQYGLRKACFRGGFTFTSAALASNVVTNVVSVDVTSMHHTFINGRRIPENFSVMHPQKLRVLTEKVLSTTREHVMSHYDKPFECAFHARIRFIGIRLRKGSCFERWGIGLLASSKFLRRATLYGDYEDGETYVASENELKSNGWHDEKSASTVFGFGKLYESDEVVVHVNELELWAMSRVYEWDEYHVIGGEGTWNFRFPPDFVTAQSNVLYAQKDAAKFIDSHYEEGIPYPYNLRGIPDGIADSLREGKCSHEFFHSWYTGTVKGMFNGIYGTMAQDILKPMYKCEGGELVVDEATITTPENFDENSKRKNRVLYTYGMRIVGGSRLHMILAIELIHEWFGKRVDVLGGDTDSMKMRCDADVTDEEISKCLEPMLIMSKRAIDKTMERLRRTFPEYSSPLTGIGGFEVENEGNHYAYHIELWNKCRVSVDKRAHVTCAGLSRPAKRYNMEDFITDMCGKYGAEKALPMCIGYNVFVSPDLSHALESKHPKVTDVFSGDVRDYTGKVSHVEVHESTALYPTGRWLGETLKPTNVENMNLLRAWYGFEPDKWPRHMQRKNGRSFIEDDYGDVLMEVY